MLSRFHWGRVLGLSMLSLSLLIGCMPTSDSIVIYSAGPRPVIERIVEQFEQESGHSVRLYTATTGQLMAKLEAERFRPQADVVIFASPVAAEALKSQNRLVPIDHLKARGTNNEWHDPDGYFLATSAAGVGIGVHARHPDYAPSWNSLLANEVGFRMVFPSPSRSGTAGDFLVHAILSDSNRWDRFAQARGQGLEFAAANSQALAGLVTGTYDVSLGAVDYLILRQIEQGSSDVRMAYPDNTGLLITRPIALMAGRPENPAREAFVRFIQTAPAQEVIASAHLLPVLDLIELTELRQQTLPAAWELFDAPRALPQQGRILRQFQYQIERAHVDRNAARDVQP